MQGLFELTWEAAKGCCAGAVDAACVLLAAWTELQLDAEGRKSDGVQSDC